MWRFAGFLGFVFCNCVVELEVKSSLSLSSWGLRTYDRNFIIQNKNNYWYLFILEHYSEMNLNSPVLQYIWWYCSVIGPSCLPQAYLVSLNRGQRNAMPFRVPINVRAEKVEQQQRPPRLHKKADNNDNRDVRHKDEHPCDVTHWLKLACHLPVLKP